MWFRRKPKHTHWHRWTGDVWEWQDQQVHHVSRWRCDCGEVVEKQEEALDRFSLVMREQNESK